MDALRRPWVGLAVALALYVALRALILVSNFDEVAMPQFELFPMGTLPLIRGVEGGLPIARVYDNAAGQLLTGWLAIPSYALFGPTYLALKLVPFALGAATLVLLWKMLGEQCDGRAAFFGAVLFALAPTTLTKYSLMASGNHFETLAFCTLALWAFWRMHRLGVTPARLFGSALACGFAVFVFFGALTPIALIAVAHLGLRGWRNTLRDSGWLAAGFGIGVAPLIVLNLLTGGRGFDFLDQKFTGRGTELDLVRVLERLREFALVHLPASTQFREFASLPGELARWLFLAAFLVAYATLLPSAWRGLRSLAVGAFARQGGARRGAALDDALAALLCAYLPITACAYALSNLKIEPKAPPMDAEGYRYFNTHFLFAVAIVALAAARLWKRAAPAGATLVAGASVAGLFNLALVDTTFARPNLGSYYDGFNLRQTANQLLTPRNGYTLPEVVRMVERYPREHRGWLYFGTGRVRAGQEYVRSKGGALELWRALEDFPAERRDEVARGFGAFFRHLGRMQSRLDPRYLALVSEKLAAGDPHAPAAVEGLATDWEVHLARDLERDLLEQEELLAQVPRELRPHLARGFGAVCGRTLARGIPFELERIAQAAASITPELREPFYEGLGAGLV